MFRAGHKIASYYRENISGTKLDRPELGRLLMDSHRNDILLVEQIDRQRQKQELNSHIRWVNIRENRSLRNGIKRYFTTGRSRKKRQMQQGTAPPRYATFRHCTDNQNHETLVKQVCRAEFIIYFIQTD